MASSFYQPGTSAPPGTTVHTSSGTYAVGCDLTVSVAGVQAVGLYFLKTAGDTTVSRGAAIYKTSDHSVVASATFTGETASGWQYIAFGSPVSLPTGVTYRLAVNLTGNYTYYSGYTNSGSILTGAQLGGGSYVSSASLIYPSNADATDYYGIDVALTGVSAGATAFYASQIGAEVWAAGSPALGASQVGAEVWVQQIPTTAVVVSQVLAEAWVSRPPLRRYRESQGVT